MKLSVVPKKLCNLIIKGLKLKFDFELNSPIYKVIKKSFFLIFSKFIYCSKKKAATLMKVKGLKYWVGRPWSSGLFTSSFEALQTCAETLLLEKRKETERNDDSEDVGMSTPNLQTPDNVHTPDNYFQTQFFSKDHPEIDQSKNAELLKRNVSKEIDIFRKILCENNSKIIKNCISTSKFWLTNSEKLPHLSKLALILMNINSSSSFIERYFSICGFVQDKRRMNISIDLFQSRCLLRANIKILNELNQIKK